MNVMRLLKQHPRRKSALGVIAVAAVICSGPALAVPALGQTTSGTAASALGSAVAPAPGSRTCPR